MKEQLINTVPPIQIGPLKWKLFANEMIDLEARSFSSSLRDSPQALRRLVESPTSIALGLTVRPSGLLAGYVAGDLLESFPNIPGIKSDPHYGHRDTSYIESLAVSPQWRHQGYGTTLMRSFLARTVEAGLKRTTAHIASWSLSKIGLRFHVLASFDNWYGTGQTFDYVEFL